MYHSVNIGDKNTYDDWHLVADSRPVINPPTPKTKYVDVPGMNGVIDMSTTLTGYPVYENRTGTITFYVLNDFVAWNVLYEEITNYLHGQEMRLSLEDEPDYYYEGRLNVKEWRSEKDRSKIIIDYNLGPFKWYVQESTDMWKWDPFNFETGVIQESLFSNLVINNTASWIQFDFPAKAQGSAPVCPKFIVRDSNNLKMRFVNKSMNLDLTYDLVDGENQFLDCLLTHADCSIYFLGSGNVSIKFRNGRL